MSQQSSNAWDVFTIAAMMMVAAAVVGSSAPLQSSRPRPGTLDAYTAPEVQSVPALLTRDPFDVTMLVRSEPQNEAEEKEQLRRLEAIRRNDSVVAPDAVAKKVAGGIRARGFQCANELTCLKKPECAGANAKIRVRVLFNLLPGDGYAETTEARRRTRYAVASSLHATGYMAQDPSRIGLMCLGAYGMVCGSCELGDATKDGADLCDMAVAFEIYTRSEHYQAVLGERCAACEHKCEGCQDNGGVSGCCVQESKRCSGTPLECESARPCCARNGQWKTPLADAVLVVWAREDRMLGATNARGVSAPLNDAIEMVERSLRLKFPDVKDLSREERGVTVETALIGPRSSAAMQRLLSRGVLHPGTVVISPTATASFESLQKLHLRETGKDLLPNDRVLSVIASDLVLSKSIVRELMQRGLFSAVRGTSKELVAGSQRPFGKLTQHRVLLLGESDHAYVRLLRWQYVNAMEWGMCHTVKAAVPGVGCPDVKQLAGGLIYHYDYFRQIDAGESEVTQTLDQDDGGVAAGYGGISRAMQSPVSTQIERPQGRSQIDYIRRIIDSAKRRLAEEPHGTQIVAVGVIATDQYDKLLILQAVRKAFPHAVFFVHDVDARLLHPRELPFTRNTIIAASYGLDPDERVTTDGRRRIGVAAPTMRDSHQSATYLATHHAATQCNACLLQTLPAFHQKGLGDPGWPAPGEKRAPECAPKGDGIDRTAWPEARVYEIGREGVVRLDPAPVDDPKRAVGWGLAIGIVLLAIFCGEFHRLWSIRTRSFVSEHKHSLWAWFRRRYLYYAVGALGGIALLGVMSIPAVARIEPIGFASGVSAWPTLALYLLTLYAAIGVIHSVCARAKMLREDIGSVTVRAKPFTLANKWAWMLQALAGRRAIPAFVKPCPRWVGDDPGPVVSRWGILAGLWPRMAPAVRDVHGWAHPTFAAERTDTRRYWRCVQSALSRRSILQASAVKMGLFVVMFWLILHAFGPNPDTFRWARGGVRIVAEYSWLAAYFGFVFAVLAFREVANVVIRTVSSLRWNRALCPDRSITMANPPEGSGEVRCVLVRGAMIEDLATEVARLAVLVLFILAPLIVSQSKVFERMVFSTMAMTLLLIPAMLWLLPLAILQTRVRASRVELVNELLEIKRGVLATGPALGANAPEVASVDAAIETIQNGGGPMAKPLLLGPFAKLLIPVVAGLALLAMHVLWGPY